MTRDRDTHARGRTRRWRAGLPAMVAALALVLATAGAASAATQPVVPGYDPAAIARAINLVTKTSQAVNEALHPPRKHH